MEYLYLKSLHIIFIVTWFAGLFYIVRLFIYFKEADKKEEPNQSILKEQYALMSKRLWYIITWPSAILASVFGFCMLYLNPDLLSQKWMLLKLLFVSGLYIYHGTCQIMMGQILKNKLKISAMKLRIWNEVVTLILFAVVFLVILKNTIHWIYGVVGLISISILLMLGIKFYKKLRAKNSWDKSEN